MPIPFLDLVSLHRSLEDDLLDVVRRALRSAQFIGGPEVEAFEQEFAAYCGVPYCAGVGSGTDAVRFALTACGVGQGDAVVTVPHTFIATVEGISQAGAEPEFVDIDESSYNLSPQALAEYLSSCDTDPATGRPLGRRSGLPLKAVVPVHLYGQCADMDPLLELAERYGLLVVEDAAQAHGAGYRTERFQVSSFKFQDNQNPPETCNLKPETRTPAAWRRAGSFGHAAAFSFYPGKNLGACGEAGAVVSSDEEVIARVKMLRDHGQVRKYYHEVEGYNGRLDAIQAGMLRVKLCHVDAWNGLRREAASRYAALLSPFAVQLPYVAPGSRPVWHLYVIRVSDRDGLLDHFKENGIGAALHYPVPVHLQKAYAHLGYREGDFPITERVCREILSLPMFPGLTAEQQAQVAGAVGEFLSTRVERE